MKCKITLKRNDNILSIIILFLFFLCAIITIFFLIALKKNYTIFSGTLDIQDTGNVGNFFGGVVGSIFGLISVLYLYKTLKFQQKEITENSISNKLHWSTNLLVEILKEIKKSTTYSNLNRLANEFNRENIQNAFSSDETIDKIKKYISILNLEFKIINKLIYQDIFTVSEVNLLRLLVYNRLGYKTFHFLICIEESIPLLDKGNNFEYNKNFHDIMQNLKYILINKEFKNSTEIKTIINNIERIEFEQQIRINDLIDRKNNLS